MPVPGALNTPNQLPWTNTAAALSRHFIVNPSGALTIGGGVGSGTLTLDGNAHMNTSARGGVTVNGSADLVLQEGGVISNNRSATGGGVALSGFNAILTMHGGSISNNFATTTTIGQGGGGVVLNMGGAQMHMYGGTIYNNEAVNSGGGVALIVDNTQFTMNGGYICSNTATGTIITIGGGGVFIGAGAGNHVTVNGGTIRNNHAVSNGGGIYTSAFTYMDPLPMGAYPQLTVAAAANFYGNTAGGGSFDPPTNAAAATDIEYTAQASGSFNHPLNNHDINFIAFGSDWFRLNSLINGTDIPTIVIHPTGSGATPGLVGTTYNLIISDQGDGNTITTIHLDGGTSPHNINVSRQVTVQAAPGENIVIRMPLPGAPNTPNAAPWLTASAALSRHFVINAGGELILGGTTGILTLDGNATLNASARGGITVNADAGLVLQTGGAIYNNRLAAGGGVSLVGFGATLDMIGGSISDNFASGTTGGGGVALTVNGAEFTMSGGTISNNISTANGGGVFLAAGANTSFEFSGGTIVNNHAVADGGGVFTSTFTYLTPLPTGAHFPQLNVSSPASFSGNTAGNGGFAPPVNAATYTEIDPVPSSGAFTHPINNLDINFLPNDWVRLNNIIATMPAATHIVIHATGSGVTPGLDNNVYNFIITDPGNGSTITTVPIAGAPAADFHRINVTRGVTIEAGPGYNIVLAMSAFATNTGAINIGRHFFVGAGHLTLSGGAMGTITLDSFSDAHDGIRGGVLVNATTGQLTMSQGSTISHGRAVDGGGVALTANGARLNLNGGTISGNASTGIGVSNGGGGVFVGGGVNSRLYFNSGSIINNHSVANGGGVFASLHTYQNPLPVGNNYPQLNVSAIAMFNGNIAGGGGSEPPSNAVDETNIEATVQVSGGSWHPLNNHDINFFMPAGDWFRLHRLVTTTTIPNIVIHPAGAGVPPGYDGFGTYNFIITDPLADPSYDGMITVAHLQGGTSPVNISVNRSVSIMAANNADILIRMPVPGAPNTPPIGPWLTTQTTLARHFTVTSGGNLTLGGLGSGTLTLDGNVSESTLVATSPTTAVRGGVNVPGGAVLVLLDGGILYNNSNGSGGAVEVSSSGVFHMHGGYITNNLATGWGGGGGVQITNDNSVFNMHGGTFNYNRAAHGGAVWTMAGTFNMFDGLITDNISGVGPGSGVTTRNHHGSGGGVMICCGGHFVMHNGTIRDNIGRSGAGVHLSHPAATDAVFTMHGGNIVGNRATVTHLNPAYLDAPGAPGVQQLIAPGIHSINSVFDMDGGGVFIMEGGLFVMADPIFPNTPPINISNNNADRHGGGIYWEVGRWETDLRTEPVIFAYNEAVEDGGGIYVSYQPLNMFGEWIITENRANRGGGVFLHGDATPVGATGTWDPDRGPGHLVMHGGSINNNWSYTSGGGVYIYRDGAFYMHGGYIEDNESAIFGGGVYVFNPGIFYTARFHVDGIGNPAVIRRNAAIYGGGVYLMYRAHMFANNVLFTENIAQRMGGAIFTELVDYGYLLSGEDVPHDILSPTPPDPTEIFNAFDNIVTTDTVRFADNEAIAAFHSPYNAFELLTYDQDDGMGGTVPGNIRWENWDTVPHQHLSAQRHPLNNYDINYVRPVYFYKTDMEVYSFPATINNRPGAVFELDMEVWCDNEGDYIWQFYTSATSEANGRVALFVFHAGRFRLREVAPPTGWYILPPGHWYLTMAIEEFEVVPGLNVFDELLYIVDPPPQPSADNWEFFFVRLDRETAGTADCEGSHEARMRWHVGNAGPRATMYLHKAGIEIFDMNPTLVSQIEDILLEGAVFALYRYTGVGTPGENDMMPAPGWVRTPLHTSTDDPDYPIALRLGFREDQDYSYYQLVELMAPVGYAAPFGQWRIRMEVLDLPLNLTTISVHTVGDPSTPTIRRLTGEDGYVFSLGNRPDFVLPMAGGLGSNGTMTFAAVGFAFIAGAGFMVYWFSLKKKARILSPVKTRGRLDT